LLSLTEFNCGVDAAKWDEIAFALCKFQEKQIFWVQGSLLVKSGETHAHQPNTKTGNRMVTNMFSCMFSRDCRRVPSSSNCPVLLHLHLFFLAWLSDFSLATQEIVQLSLAAPTKHKNQQGVGDQCVFKHIGQQLQMGANLFQAPGSPFGSTSLRAFRAFRLDAGNQRNCPTSMSTAAPTKHDDQQEDGDKNVVLHQFSCVLDTNCKWAQTCSKHPDPSLPVPLP
jgi:hypothetical protein